MTTSGSDHYFDDFNSLFLVASMHAVLDMITNSNTDLRDWMHERITRLEQVAREIGWDDEPEWIYDTVNDETTLDSQALRILYASLAVIIASGAESVVEAMCAHYKLMLGSRPTWGEKKNALEKRIKLSFESLPGFRDNKLARLLGNCFKHSDGYVSQELAEFSGMRKGDEIEYETLAWKSMIDGTEKFLLALCEKVAKMASQGAVTGNGVTS